MSYIVEKSLAPILDELEAAKPPVDGDTDDGE
jgi:hypothetical protein